MSFWEEAHSERNQPKKQSRISTEALRRRNESVVRYRKEQVLEYLRRKGRATCREIEDRFHRGQTPVRELRLGGHSIDTVSDNGVMSYVYRGFNRMGDRARNDYWKTPSPKCRNTALQCILVQQIASVSFFGYFRRITTFKAVKVQFSL